VPAPEGPVFQSGLLVEPGVKRRRRAAQISPAVAIAKADMAAAGSFVRAVIDLIVGAAAVGAHVMTVGGAAMVLILWRQQRHRNVAIGELLDTGEVCTSAATPATAAKASSATLHINDFNLPSPSPHTRWQKRMAQVSGNLNCDLFI
jgi:hypothetical protein